MGLDLEISGRYCERRDKGFVVYDRFPYRETKVFKLSGLGIQPTVSILHGRVMEL